jgi:hypothetical protein
VARTLFSAFLAFNLMTLLFGEKEIKMTPFTYTELLLIKISRAKTV